MVAISNDPIKMLLLAFSMLALVSCAAEESSSDESALVQMSMNVAASDNGGHGSGLFKDDQALARLNHTQEKGEKQNKSFSLAKQPATNEAGDLGVLLAGLKANIISAIMMLVIFMVLARFFPSMYSFRATGAYGQPKTAPVTWDADDYQWFRWIKVSYNLTFEETIETCGLDQAMLLRQFVMAMEIALFIGIPNFIVLVPLYWFKGGYFAGADYLSYWGINNVTWPSEEYTWIYWPVAIMVWYNTIIIQYRLFAWQRYFIPYRNIWLERMPAPRDTTLLVEGIDDEVCSDAELKQFYEKMYGQGTILDAFVVKKVASLRALVEEYKAADQNLHEIQYFIQKNPDKPRPKFRIGGADEEEYYAEEKKRLTSAIKDEQARINLEAKKAPDETDIYATNGFVTFKSTAQCTQALMTRLRSDQGSFVMSIPPDPADIIWEDLEMPAAKQETLQVIGWAMVAGLGAAYMPCIVGISILGSPAFLETIEPFKSWFEATPSLKATVSSLTASLGLTIMASFLPTFLMLIFTNFFYLKANRWAQLMVQKFYFWFLVFFVLLISSVGSSIVDTFLMICANPFYACTVLGEYMPYATHFYMNYQVLQWVTEAMNMLRYIPLTKYLIFKRFCDPERARALSEPEDQDYYGIGSRHSQNTMKMLIAIIFGTICPLQTVFSFVSFLFNRLVYGYLIPFAECRKSDLGGEHWVQAMHHIHYGVFIYLLLMVGVLSIRSLDKGPVYFAGFAFVWWALSYHKFQHKLSWENLSFEEVVKTQKMNIKKRTPTKDSYRQEWLNANIFEKIEIH